MLNQQYFCTFKFVLDFRWEKWRRSWRRILVWTSASSSSLHRRDIWVIKCQEVDEQIHLYQIVCAKLWPKALKNSSCWVGLILVRFSNWHGSGNLICLKSGSSNTWSITWLTRGWNNQRMGQYLSVSWTMSNAPGHFFLYCEHGCNFSSYMYFWQLCFCVLNRIRNNLSFEWTNVIKS